MIGAGRPAVYIRANRPAPRCEVERDERSAAGEFDCVMEEEAELVAGDGEEVVSAAVVSSSNSSFDLVDHELRSISWSRQ